MRHPATATASSVAFSVSFSVSFSVAFWAALALTVPGCGKSAEEKPPRAANTEETAANIEVVDDLGRKHRFNKSVARVVSLSPALTEVLFAVGCGQALVMRDGWSNYPRAAMKVPAIKGLKPSAEAVLAAHPDVVLSNFPPETLRTALASAKVPIVAFNPSTFSEIASSFERIAAICGKPENGKELAGDFLGEVKAVAAQVAGRKRPRVFLELDAGADGQPYTLGKGAFGHELLEAAGGINAFADGRSAWFQVSVEAVIAANPDVILLADALSTGNKRDPASVGKRPGWNAIAAVRSERVHDVMADWVSRPGPRLVLGLRQVAAVLHPDAFKGAK